MCASVGCAHDARRDRGRQLESAVKQLHLLLRWKDFEGAARLMVPEKRERFAAAREEQGDDRDLTIADYEVLDASIDDQAESAVITSTISWMRLPSTSLVTERVRSRFVFQDGAWLLEQQDGGPFADLR
jgi:hypothetical protein